MTIDLVLKALIVTCAACAIAHSAGYIHGRAMRVRAVVPVSALATYGFIGGYTEEIDPPRWTEVRL